MEKLMVLGLGVGLDMWSSACNRHNIGTWSNGEREINLRVQVGSRKTGIQGIFLHKMQHGHGNYS